MYGYSPRQNGYFDKALDSLKVDAEVYGGSVYSKSNVHRLFSVLEDRLGKEESSSEASLAVIGMVEQLIKCQADISDKIVTVFMGACERDPYALVPERSSHIRSLRRSLKSYISDNSLRF